MNYPKLTLLLLLLIIVCTATGCSSSRPRASSDPDTLAKIMRTGEMQIGYVNFDPCVIRDPVTGKLSGSFVDAVERICSELKVKPVYHETTLRDFAAGLQAGRYDVCIGPTYRTIGRAASVGFTRPLAYIGNSGAALRKQASRFRSINDLNNPTVRIAVLQGQAMEAYCRNHLPKATLVVVGGDQGLTAPLAAVSAGRADVGLSNSVTVYRYCQQHVDTADLFAHTPVEVAGLCWSVRPEDTRLLLFLNDSIDYLDDSGQLDEWQSKYSTPLFEKASTLRLPNVIRREP